MKLLLLMFVAALGTGGSVRAEPVVSVPPRSQFGWSGKRIGLSVTATGTAPLSYQWQRGGSNLETKTNRTLTINPSRVSDSGSYRVVISDSMGTITSAAAEVLVRDWPQPTGPVIPELTRLDADMQTVLTGHGIPGGSLAVVKDGRLVFARGYGWADAENDERFQPDTLCQMASLTKTITAATVLKLVEEGKLALTNQAFSFLNLEPPTYPGAALDPRLGAITVRHLLSHTGGWVASAATNPSGALGFDAAFWPDLTEREMGLMEVATPTEFVRWMMGKPLQAIPGSRYAYSSVGYLAAGRLVEAITGQGFETVARQLLAQAGITRTRMGHNARSERFPAETVCYLHPSITPELAFGTDNWSEPKPLDMDFPYAYPLTALESAGGFVGSAIDQARFIAAIDGLPSFPDILSTNSVNAMASGMLGWDSFLSTGGANPVSGIWGKLGVLPGAIGKAVKWRNGVVFVYLLNTWETAVDPELYDRLQLSFGRGPWPVNDLFPMTLSHDSWRAKHFSPLELADAGIGAEAADPDADGQPNLLEYAQGTNPRVANEPVGIQVRTVASQDAVATGIRYRRLLLEHEVDYRVEESSDLRTWSAVPVDHAESVLNEDGTVTVTQTVGASTQGGAHFFRVRVARK